MYLRYDNSIGGNGRQSDFSAMQNVRKNQSQNSHYAPQPCPPAPQPMPMPRPQPPHTPPSPPPRQQAPPYPPPKPQPPPCPPPPCGNDCKKGGGGFSLLKNLPRGIYDPETGKFLGLFSGEDVLIIGVILIVLERGDKNDIFLLLALFYILLSDRIDFGNILC